MQEEETDDKDESHAGLHEKSFVPDWILLKLKEMFKCLLGLLGLKKDLL